MRPSIGLPWNGAPPLPTTTFDDIGTPVRRRVPFATDRQEPLFEQAAGRL